MKQQPLGHEFGILESQRWQRLMGRLLDILEKRYQGIFRYLPFQQDSADWKLLSSLLHRKQMVRLNGCSYFPVMHDQQIAGAVQFTGSELAPQTVQWINEVVDLVAPLAFFKGIEMDSLLRLEQQMELLDAPSGVVRLDERRGPQRGLAVRDLFSEDQTRHRDFSQQIQKAPCFLDSHSSLRAMGEAFRLHGESGNRAFVPYQDLDFEVRTDESSLSQLRDVTVYLRDPQLLSLDERTTLLMHLRRLASQNRIYWLVSSSKSYGELLRSHEIEMSLLRALSIRVMKLDQISLPEQSSSTPSNLH